MDKGLAALIRRAVHSDRELFPLNASWQYLHGEYNIGVPMGNRIRLSARDKEELVELVRRMTGMDLRSVTTSDLADMTRSEALQHTRHEKWGGRAVSAGRLVLKTLPGKRLGLNRKAWCLPHRSHLDIAAEAIESIQHDAILVIENYECFDRMDAMQWALEEPFVDPLVIYRGDPNTSRADAVNAFLRASKRPVLAMVDLDPAGLLIALALPFVVGIIAPGKDSLESLFGQGNPSLYHQQRPAAEKVLASCSYPAIREMWDLIARHQAGLVQERWLRGDVRLVLHPLAVYCEPIP